jgi:hypothetical protein
MGKPAGVIRDELQGRLGQIARELGREIDPDGLPRGTKFSELEAIAGDLGDEIARQLIETNIRGQAEEWPDDELGECPSCGGPARKAPTSPACSPPRGGTSPGKNASPTALTVGGLFPPQNQLLGLDHTGFSPRVQQKMVYAGVKNVSYKQADDELAEVADLKIGSKPIERLAKRIGQERIDQRDAAVARHQPLPLIEEAVADPRRPCPAVAMVSMDGGRLPIRSPSPPESEPKPSRHWRESKTAVLETSQSEVHPADPDPDVPRCFLDLKRTAELVRGQGHALPVGLEFEGQAGSAKLENPTPPDPDRATRPGRPQRLVRSLLAS